MLVVENKSNVPVNVEAWASSGKYAYLVRKLAANDSESVVMPGGTETLRTKIPPSALLIGASIDDIAYVLEAGFSYKVESVWVVLPDGVAERRLVIEPDADGQLQCLEVDASRSTAKRHEAISRQ
ncbi:MAG: hypothetical protein K2Y21_06475 [Phycisphaerales bacterium]|nr:hypothetical protein [Phycisphaerales bacterium]